MSTKGMRYYLTRIEDDHVSVGSRPQTIEDIKSVLISKQVVIEIGLQELHQTGTLKIQEPSPNGWVETILQAKRLH